MEWSKTLRGGARSRDHNEDAFRFHVVGQKISSHVKLNPDHSKTKKELMRSNNNRLQDPGLEIKKKKEKIERISSKTEDKKSKERKRRLKPALLFEDGDKSRPDNTIPSVSSSTIAEYINRFRNGPPTSPERRRKSRGSSCIVKDERSSGDGFWWKKHESLRKHDFFRENNNKSEGPRDDSFDPEERTILSGSEIEANEARVNRILAKVKLAKTKQRLNFGSAVQSGSPSSSPISAYRYNRPNNDNLDFTKDESVDALIKKAIRDARFRRERSTINYLSDEENKESFGNETERMEAALETLRKRGTGKHSNSILKKYPRFGTARTLINADTDSNEVCSYQRSTLLNQRANEILEKYSKVLSRPQQSRPRVLSPRPQSPESSLSLFSPSSASSGSSSDSSLKGLLLVDNNVDGDVVDHDANGNQTLSATGDEVVQLELVDEDEIEKTRCIEAGEKLRILTNNKKCTFGDGSHFLSSCPSLETCVETSPGSYFLDSESSGAGQTPISIMSPKSKSVKIETSISSNSSIEAEVLELVSPTPIQNEGETHLKVTSQHELTVNTLKKDEVEENDNFSFQLKSSPKLETIEISPKTCMLAAVSEGLTPMSIVSPQNSVFSVSTEKATPRENTIQKTVTETNIPNLSKGEPELLSEKLSGEADIAVSRSNNPNEEIENSSRDVVTRVMDMESITPTIIPVSPQMNHTEIVENISPSPIVQSEAVEFQPTTENGMYRANQKIILHSPVQKEPVRDQKCAENTFGGADPLPENHSLLCQSVENSSNEMDTNMIGSLSMSNSTETATTLLALDALATVNPRNETSDKSAFSQSKPPEARSSSQIESQCRLKEGASTAKENSTLWMFLQNQKKNLLENLKHLEMEEQKLLDALNASKIDQQ